MERIDTKTKIICKPSSTNFFDLTIDCQRHFFRNVTLKERILLRAVCSQWKELIEDSLKNIKKLRIFDGRQSLSDYAYTLARSSLQSDPELSFGPYDTLILTIPKRLANAAAKEAAKKKAEKEEKERKAAEAQAKKEEAEQKKWKEDEALLLAAIDEAKKRYEELRKSPKTSGLALGEADKAMKNAMKNYKTALKKREKIVRSVANSANSTSNRINTPRENIAFATAQREAEIRQQHEHIPIVHFLGEPEPVANLILRIQRFDRMDMLVADRRGEGQAQPNVLRQRHFPRPLANRRVEEVRAPEQLKHKHSDLSDFLGPLFPSVNSLAIWTNYITCTPCQVDVGKLISAWQCNLQVLSVRIYASGAIEAYDGIDMSEYLILRKRLLDVISKLPNLRRFHMGESELTPNHHLSPTQRLSTERAPRAFLSFQLNLPPSVGQLSLNFRVFDSTSRKMFEELKKANHLTEFDVTYMNTKLVEPRFFLLDIFKDMPEIARLRIDFNILKTELNKAHRRGDGAREEADVPQEKVLSTNVIGTIHHITLTDRYNFLHNNSREVSHNSASVFMQAEIFRALGLVVPKLQSLTMASRYADDEEYQNFVRTLVYSNCPLCWADMLHFEKIPKVTVDEKLLQFWPLEDLQEMYSPVAGPSHMGMPRTDSVDTVASATANEKKRRTPREAVSGVSGGRPVNKRIRFTETDEVLEEEVTEVELAADKLRFNMTKADELITFFSEEENESDDGDEIDDIDDDDDD